MLPESVSGEPTKKFFIHTITRDISLEDCILDLIDNSLDGAKRQLGHPEPHLDEKIDLSAFKISISFSEEKFEISDNCGGISLNDAVSYAFTFGAKEDEEPEDFSIGLYGIGMKRAAFKMGDIVSVKSTFAGDSENEPASFEVPINVPEWRKEKAWDFDIQELDPMAESGVKIEITSLHSSVKSEFNNITFLNALRRVVARDYSQFISKGLFVSINGRKIKPYDFTFLTGADFAPYRDRARLKDVDIEIVAGVAARPSESLDPDEDGGNEDRSGWYVLCNGRIVLAADKSDLTGWGYDGKNRWHPQYRGFMGLILFSAKHAAALPLTTTKRSIDKENEVYRLALVRMMELTRSWIEYTNHRKLDIPAAKISEGTAKPITLKDIPASKVIHFPSFTIVKPRVKEVTIQYAKLPDRVRRLAIALGDPAMSARQVGSDAFEYAFEELVGGDD